MTAAATRRALALPISLSGVLAVVALLASCAAPEPSPPGPVAQPPAPPAARARPARRAAAARVRPQPPARRPAERVAEIPAEGPATPLPEEGNGTEEAEGVVPLPPPERRFLPRRDAIGCYVLSAVAPARRAGGRAMADGLCVPASRGLDVPQRAVRITPLYILLEVVPPARPAAGPGVPLWFARSDVREVGEE